MHRSNFGIYSSYKYWRYCLGMLYNYNTSINTFIFNYYFYLNSKLVQGYPMVKINNQLRNKTRELHGSLRDYFISINVNYHISLSQLESVVSLVGVLESPLSSISKSSLLVLLPEISDILIKWVIKIWSGHQSLNRKEHSSNLESWRPLSLQDI